jgi:Probable N6-adenine methyltransferase
MRERQEIEQYFFDGPTLAHLAALASRFKNPCCLCTPSLGEELERRGLPARTLDLDERFSYLRGFRHYDLDNAEPLDEQFGIIICDPPFLSVSLPGLFKIMDMLSGNNYGQPLLINYLSSRATAITAAFAPFGLQATGFEPGYETIQNVGRNKMEFFGNLGPRFPLKPGVLAIEPLT